MSASCELLAGAVALPAARVSARGGCRCAAQYDEDAVTLAAEAALSLLAQDVPAPCALILATVAPPYEEGGSAQLIAEIAGLDEDVFVAELSATPRDGLAALRLATGLVAAGDGPVLVCASHRTRGAGEREAGDGAVALLVGHGDGLARITPLHSHAEELRDRWRLPGDLAPREGDASFSEEFGPSRVARELAQAASEREVGTSATAGATAPALVAGPSARAASRVERAFNGGGDPAFPRTGALGCAHPLLRLLLGLAEPALVVAASGGLGESLEVQPRAGATALAEEIHAQVAAGEEVEHVLATPKAVGFEPYASAPRAWRERGQDLRLEGVVHEGRLHYPPPAGLEGERRALPRRGRVLTATFDHVYPGGDGVGMAVVTLDGGARFYCQVVPGAKVTIDEEVELVPRRLHAGGGIVQYFWKAIPCR
ncbi:MAG: Zn-ribbon domain-containing OB-fold protein [Solirubrobacteraceae bacterium]